MAEMIIDINDLPSYLMSILRTNKVKVNENNQRITVVPVDEPAEEGEFSCPFIGIAADSSLTVEKFLEWKRAERVAENEKELHS